VDLAHVHEALLATHEHLLQNPADEVEGLEGASCPPHVKHLAQIAMESAGEGRSAQQWRSTIVDGLGSGIAPLVDEAESCMRSAGLWPWG
jgi:hypothetical protein